MAVLEIQTIKIEGKGEKEEEGRLGGKEQERKEGKEGKRRTRMTDLSLSTHLLGKSEETRP
jgi:hypothetical protein